MSDIRNKCRLECMCKDEIKLICDDEYCIRYKAYKQGRADERAKIVSMIEEIAHYTLYCMADMCDREDKNCEKCALEYVINRIKEQK